jgi:chromate transporter
MQERPIDNIATVPLRQVGLWELVRYFLRLGAFGFGGPIALAGYMQRDLIPRGWIKDEAENMWPIRRKYEKEFCFL